MPISFGKYQFHNPLLTVTYWPDINSISPSLWPTDLISIPYFPSNGLLTRFQCHIILLLIYSQDICRLLSLGQNVALKMPTKLHPHKQGKFWFPTNIDPHKYKYTIPQNTGNVHKIHCYCMFDTCYVIKCAFIQNPWIRKQE